MSNRKQAKAIAAQVRMIGNGWSILFMPGPLGIRGLARKRTTDNNLTVQKDGRTVEDVAIELEDAAEDAWKDLAEAEAKTVPQEAANGSS